MLARVRIGGAVSLQKRDEAYVLAVEATSNFISVPEHRQSERSDIPGLYGYESTRRDQFGQTSAQA